MLISIIMRTFGWRVIFARHGMLNDFLLSVDLIARDLNTGILAMRRHSGYDLGNSRSRSSATSPDWMLGRKELQRNRIVNGRHRASAGIAGTT